MTALSGTRSREHVPPADGNGLEAPSGSYQAGEVDLLTAWHPDGFQKLFHMDVVVRLVRVVRDHPRMISPSGKADRLLNA